jgi:glycosyltransferase involved in cell wall biosynthesis
MTQPGAQSDRTASACAVATEAPDARRRDGSVVLVMATCNGEQFLAEQITSIRAQTFSHWRLLVRDDASTDRTRELLRGFGKLDRRLVLIDDDDGRLGVVGNFNRLIGAALELGADFCLFADQDDVWEPDKIERQLAEMTRLENRLGKKLPLLVHSDLAVVTAALDLVHPSLLRYARIRHEPREPLRTLLVQNFVTGSTCLANRRLLELAASIPAEAVMHDWWLALVAAATGVIGFLPAATVRYRQHRGNALGADSFWASVNPLHKSWNPMSPNGLRQFLATIVQARALRAHLVKLGDRCPRESLGLVESYCRLFEPGVSRFQRVRRVGRLRIARQEPIRNAALRLRLLLTPTRAFLDQPHVESRN